MALHRQNNELAEQCPVRDVLDRLGDRWTVLVLSELQVSKLRFGALRKNIPDISPRMLSQTLRQLEQDGLVNRQVFASIPPRVDYSLTDLGQSFFACLQGVIQWANNNHEAVRAARKQYIAPEGHAAK